MANKVRLIDANATMRKINAFAASVVYRGSNLMITGKDSCNPHEYTRGYEQGVLDAQKIVSGQDPVDAVEVVRCKNCERSALPDVLTQKYGEPGTLTCHNWKSPCNKRNVRSDGFCPYGERRAEK